jgi:hypothetical protein
MKLKITATRRKATPKINYDYIGGDADNWVADVVDFDFEGGYYTPANRSGHPDNWSPEEGEDPEVNATLYVWVTPEDGSDPEVPCDPNKPDFVVEVKNSRCIAQEGFPAGLEAWINDTVVPGMIEGFWRDYRRGRR